MILRTLCITFFIALLTIGGAQAQQTPRGLSPCALGVALSPPTTLSVNNISSTNVQLSVCGPTVLLMNITSQEAFYNVGPTSSTAATVNSYSIPGNSFQLLTVPSNGAGGWWLAAITAANSTTLRVVQGTAQ